MSNTALELSGQRAAKLCSERVNVGLQSVTGTGVLASAAPSSDAFQCRRQCRNTQPQAEAFRARRLPYVPLK
jgi:hypothetical protein